MTATQPTGDVAGTGVEPAATGIDTGTEELTCEIDGHIAVLSFNRPDRRNALAPSIYRGFEAALPVIADRDDLRVVMLTGAGGAFCSGGDVKAMNERNRSPDGATPDGGRASVEQKVADLRARQRQVSLTLRQLPQPVVAAVPGPAAGAGFSIAMAADIRLAAERAVFVTAFSNVGGSGDFGGSWFLTRLVGAAKAKELYFMSPKLSAADARDLGLVNRVLPDDGFHEAALDFCRELAARPPIALRYMKENINRADHVDLAAALDAEAPAMVRSMSTEDHKEAAAAFVEKRTPSFRGH